MSAHYLDHPLSPHPLLAVNQTSDFSRNSRKLEASYKRPYSLAKVVSEYPRLTGFEMEVNEKLRSLNYGRNEIGPRIPIEVLPRRDLTLGGLPQVVQTSGGEEIIPFLPYKSVTGRLGATLLTDW